MISTFHKLLSLLLLNNLAFLESFGESVIVVTEEESTPARGGIRRWRLPIKYLVLFREPESPGSKMI